MTTRFGVALGGRLGLVASATAADQGHGGERRGRQPASHQERTAGRISVNWVRPRRTDASSAPPIL